LVNRTADCVAQLQASAGTTREALREVLDAITRGQRLDLDHFGLASPNAPVELPGDDALFAYADDVAGSVGRFWTRIASQSDARFASQPLDAMLAWGTRYGRALQWINIIRDLHEDLPNGRAYLNPGRVDEWLKRAEAGLHDGLRYTASLRTRRLRLATVLPAMIGAATIRKLRESGTGYLTERVKISRDEAGAIVRGTLWRLALNRPLEGYFESLLQPNPANSGGTGASKASGTPVTG
jgi:farnesyl-diphosphate farnesyltransferase